jgi:hypothetical protein
LSSVSPLAERAAERRRLVRELFRQAAAVVVAAIRAANLLAGLQAGYPLRSVLVVSVSLGRLVALEAQQHSVQLLQPLAVQGVLLLGHLPRAS